MLRPDPLVTDKDGNALAAKELQDLLGEELLPGRWIFGQQLSGRNRTNY